ncbi:SGNH/GDSL hydrolase family protein [Burkholderia stagnalis]|uniref:SGNH/GDSL hydrolase family protein n=1 Tax=Burkholderia stagnalis TaxID=1503054 RepID=UPI000F8105E5|nr:SGNH/GDSL hydrolase family protein [Burkholderia stagnalis]
MTIYLAGDSAIWGVDLDNTSNPQQAPGVGNIIVGRASPFPAQLMQADMDAAFGPGVVAVIDGSIPGSTLTSDLNGTAPSVAPLASRLAALPIHAHIVITNSEINDQYVLGENVSTYSSWVKKWIGVVTAYGAVPVYAEPNPICRSDMNVIDPSTGTNALVYAAGQAFLAAGGTVLPNLAAWENYTTPPNARPWNIAFMSSDCVHPNQAGYRFKEANYLPALVPLVKRILALSPGSSRSAIA